MTSTEVDADTIFHDSLNVGMQSDRRSVSHKSRTQNIESS